MFERKQCLFLDRTVLYLAGKQVQRPLTAYKQQAVFQNTGRIRAGANIFIRVLDFLFGHLNDDLAISGRL